MENDFLKCVGTLYISLIAMSPMGLHVFVPTFFQNRVKTTASDLVSKYQILFLFLDSIKIVI